MEEQFDCTSDVHLVRELLSADSANALLLCSDANLNEVLAHNIPAPTAD
jgi:hypothetical protein